MIDTHCHLDLHDEPVNLVRRMNAADITCVAVTMLPSHYRLGVPHLAPFEKLHAALGLHPLRITEGAREIKDFIALSKTTSYIGEIGLDFSREGKSTKSLQIKALSQILASVKGGKFVTVHSRQAVPELLRMLGEAEVSPVCFHYFTGETAQAEKVVEAGHFFSLNSKMLEGKHRVLLDVIPRNRILVETDAPYLTKDPIFAIEQTYAALAKGWGVPLSEAVDTLSENFAECRT